MGLMICMFCSTLAALSLNRTVRRRLGFLGVTGVQEDLVQSTCHPKHACKADHNIPLI